MQLSTTQISWTQGHPNAQPFLMLATQMHGDARRSREDSCCSASTMFNRLFGKLEQEANALATLEKLSETLEMVEKKENDLVKKAVAAEVEEGRSCKWDHTYIHMSWLIVCIIQRNLPLKDWEQPVIFFKFSFTFTPRLWLQELFRETYYEAS
ncbi:uncharacterized protein LOC103502077 isoform X3 [Cucumis melo]|uniref:Uncharacterized protein LOC103502077 isoform X3 n=2 Tax=Cucumis melo TaxID=3656 RepID=A0ABM3KCB2_CUCME|nr:uncharacterized protein LOC103502077 isoform X3 [Cucumis melo]